MNPMIHVLIAALPPAGEVWTFEQQEVWLDLMRLVLAHVYYLPIPDADNNAPSAKAKA